MLNFLFVFPLCSRAGLRRPVQPEQHHLPELGLWHLALPADCEYTATNYRGIVAEPKTNKKAHTNSQRRRNWINRGADEYALSIPPSPSCSCTRRSRYVSQNDYYATLKKNVDKHRPKKTIRRKQEAIMISIRDSPIESAPMSQVSPFPGKKTSTRPPVNYPRKKIIQLNVVRNFQKFRVLQYITSSKSFRLILKHGVCFFFVCVQLLFR